MGPPLALCGRIRRGRVARWCLPAGLLGCSALLATACSLGPRYHKPDLPTPDHWVTAGDPQAPEWPSTDWWRGFGSHDLDALIAAAPRANDDLRAAIARVQQADAERRIAGAPLFPALAISAQATRARAAATSGGSYATGNDFSTLLAARYQLDFLGRTRALYAAAPASAHASRYDRTTVE